MNSNKTVYISVGIIALILLVSIGTYFTKQSNQSSSSSNQTKGALVTPGALETSATSTVSKNTIQNHIRKSASAVNQPSLPKPTAPTPVVPPLPEGTDQFTIALDGTTSTVVAQKLLDNGFITDQKSFISIVTKSKAIFTAGAYKLSNTMTPQQIITVLSGKPYMKWVLIPEGLRKEEIAILLAKNLDWTNTKKEEFIKATNVDPNYSEGVYFPNTYLIPIAESPSDVANRLISKFNEKFGALLPQFNSQNIKWTSGLTLASIVQREASNNSDTALIAGILWNRLEQEMPLGVDATLQYVRGNKGAGFWAPITVADKKTDSPYNTYVHPGLPPHPISNPGLPAIEAVLNPASTTCLYYIHDSHRVTHCATTYEEHMVNIKKYL